MKSKRAKPRRAVHPVQPAHRVESDAGLNPLSSLPLSSPNFRKIAAGRPCMVRLPGCDGGGETTVLAHYRMSGFCGVGIKPDDLAFGSWACVSCARLSGEGAITENRFALAEGVMRTVFALKQLGFVK